MTIGFPVVEILSEVISLMDPFTRRILYIIISSILSSRKRTRSKRSIIASSKSACAEYGEQTGFIIIIDPITENMKKCEHAKFCKH